MEKESKVIISSEDGEWGREPIQKLSQRGVRPLFLRRDSTLLLTKIREEHPQLVVMEFFDAGPGRHRSHPRSQPRRQCGEPPVHSDLLLHKSHDGTGDRRGRRGLFRPVPL